MQGFRKGLLQTFVFCLATADFAYAGWLMPTKNEKEFNALAFAVAAIAALSIGWLVVRLTSTASKTAAMFFLCAVFVISGIIHPVFESARAAKDHVQCISNLKQLCLSSITYSGDYDDRFPPAIAWRSLTESYRGNRRGPVVPDPLIRCPLATSPWSYGFNALCSALDSNKIRDPQQTPLLFDCDAQEPNASGGRESVSGRHKDVAGFAFSDGHTTFHRPDGLAWAPD